MYCPSCGKQIPDQSQFCSHCGKPTMIASSPAETKVDPKSTEWEHIHFSLDWKRGQGGKYTLSLGHTEQSARQFFWGNFQGNILPQLQRVLDEGWQPVTEIGPNAFIFYRHGGNPQWLEVATFRVKLRRPRTSPLAPHELKVMGKWQHLDTTGGGLMVKMVQGLAAMTGGQVKSFEFGRENLFVGHASNFLVSGVYTFLDDHHISMTADPPKVFSVTAELNGTYDTMIIHDMGGLKVRYRKA